MPKTPDEIKKELVAPVPVHFHRGNPEPNLTPLALRDLEVLHTNALALIQQKEAESAEQAERIKQLEAENAQLLEKVDRFSKTAFEQNMAILGKQDVITKQERVRANLQSEIWQLKQQVPHWISVEERLPEAHKIVLVYVTNQIGLWTVKIDWMDERGWVCSADSEWHIITHWMPLPSGPKEEEK